MPIEDLDEIDVQPLWKPGDPYPDDWVAAELLHLAEGNPRRGDTDEIAESIQINGWFGRLGVQKWSDRQGSSRIVIGNHRFRAGLQIGMEFFPVTLYDCDDRRGDFLVLADNRYSDKAQWDDADLIVTLRGFDNDLAGSGFTDMDLELLLEGLNGVPDTGDEDGGRATSGGVKVSIGTIKFEISREEWDAFEARLTAEVGTRHEDQVAEVRGTLGL